MITVSNISVWGFEHAVRGMRNPLNSWDKSDSTWIYDIPNAKFHLGKNDLDLMRRLYQAGTEHRKYLRQIFVSMDITAPLYWWKEFDTYKIGTVANSCSTMHKIQAKEFTLDDFSVEHIGDVPNCDPVYLDMIYYVIQTLNEARHCYLDTKDKKYWWQMIQLLPSSYNQKRTVTMNYENVMSMIKQRAGHRLDEWNEFVEILLSLPHIEEIRDGQ